METIQEFTVEYLKPVSECNPDELEQSTDEGCWLLYGDVEAESEAHALQIVSEKMSGRKTRIHEG